MIAQQSHDSTDSPDNLKSFYRTDSPASIDVFNIFYAYLIISVFKKIFDIFDILDLLYRYDSFIILYICYD